MLLFVQLCALRASNGCKDDMGTLSWLNAETLKRVITLLFGTLIRCSVHKCSFTRLHYCGQDIFKPRNAVHCWTSVREL